MLPTVDVFGIGADVEAVPPEETVYHLSELPELAVAVSGVDWAFLQYEIGVATIGAEREEPTATDTDTVPVHPKLSFTITVCTPEETFIKVAVGEKAGTKGDASNEYVNGAVPVVVETKIVPLFTPVQEVEFAVADAETPVPSVSTAVFVP